VPGDRHSYRDKSSSSRRANLSGVKRTYVRRSGFEMQRNAESGLFAEPSNIGWLEAWALWLLAPEPVTQKEGGGCQTNRSAFSQRMDWCYM
jgi:hypothetical protein